MSHRETRPAADVPPTLEELKQEAANLALREAIAKRAFELYLQRGSESGYEVEDWLAAEAELTAVAAATKPTKG
jgi:Protein of unknown function (DUF2934)